MTIIAVLASTSLCTAATRLVAQSLAARDPARTRGLVACVAAATFAVGLLLAGLLLAFPEPLLRAVGCADVLLGPAGAYLRVRALGVPFALLLVGLQGCYNAATDTVTPLVAILATGVLNGVLDPVLMFGPGDGPRRLGAPGPPGGGGSRGLPRGDTHLHAARRQRRGRVEPHLDRRGPPGGRGDGRPPARARAFRLPQQRHDLLLHHRDRRRRAPPRDGGRARRPPRGQPPPRVRRGPLRAPRLHSGDGTHGRHGRRPLAQGARGRADRRGRRPLRLARVRPGLRRDSGRPVGHGPVGARPARHLGRAARVLRGPHHLLPFPLARAGRCRRLGPARGHGGREPQLTAGAYALRSEQAPEAELIFISPPRCIYE